MRPPLRTTLEKAPVVTDLYSGGSATGLAEVSLRRTHVDWKMNTESTGPTRVTVSEAPRAIEPDQR